MRQVQAFGATESLANIQNTWLVVRRATGWTEVHQYPLGQVVHVYNRTIVVAALDGYIGLLESDVAPAETIAALQK